MAQYNTPISTNTSLQTAASSNKNDKVLSNSADIKASPDNSPKIKTKKINNNNTSSSTSTNDITKVSASGDNNILQAKTAASHTNTITNDYDNDIFTNECTSLLSCVSIKRIGLLLHFYGTGINDISLKMDFLNSSVLKDYCLNNKWLMDDYIHILSMEPQTPLKGTAKQRAQAPHGYKGAPGGAEHGSKSLTADRYVDYHEAVKRGDITGLGRNKKTAKNAPMKCAALLTFDQQLDFIAIWEQKLKENGFNQHGILMDCANKMFGAVAIQKDYSKRNQKKNLRTTLNRIIKHRREIKCMVLINQGHQKVFNKGKAPHNPYEADIRDQLEKMQQTGMEIDKDIIDHTAICVSIGKGMQIRLGKDYENGIAKMLENAMFSGLKEVIHEGNTQNVGGKVFHVTDGWRQGFVKRQDIKYGRIGKSEVDIFSVLTNLEPSLEYVWLMRKIYDIPGGQGRIMNADQTMYYRLYQSKYGYICK